MKQYLHKWKEHCKMQLCSVNVCGSELAEKILDHQRKQKIAYDPELDTRGCKIEKQQKELQ